MNLSNRSPFNPTSPERPSHGLFVAADQKPVPLIGVRAKGRMQGRIIVWTITQRYRNVGKKPIEAVYAFPLPEESTIHGLRIRIGDKVLHGQIKERDEAFETYDEAMASGDGAFLLDQEEPNHFLMSVGNLLPGQEVEVEVEFLAPAACHEKGVRVSLPTTISPRYSSPDLPPEEMAEIQRITPPYADSVPYGLSLTLEASFASEIRVVESPSHPIRSEISGNRATVSLSQGEVALDRDLVFLFETAEPHAAGAWTGTMLGREHVAVELIPDLGEEGRDTPRRVTFLLDCSGSMSGDSIDQARRAVELCLRSLSEGDRFQIVRFGSSFEALFREPQSYSQATLDRAIELVRGIEANLGGTEILPALQSLSMKGQMGEGELLDIVLMTDGEVSATDQVLAWARENRAHCRVFSFGIGAGASDYLVNGVARESRGAAEFIFPGERIEDKVLRQFSRLRTPMMGEIEIDWAGLTVEAAPVGIPPVFDRDPLLIFARLPKGKTMPADGVVRLSGLVGKERKTWEARIRPAEEGEAIARWWARLRIRDLEQGLESARHGSNQNRAKGPGKAVREAVDLSTSYGILSARTSFIAVEERSAAEKAQEQAELRQIPVMITKGWHGRDSITLGGGIPGFIAAVAPAGGIMSRLSAVAGAVCSSVSKFDSELREIPAFLRKRSASPAKAQKGIENDIQMKCCELNPKYSGSTGSEAAIPPYLLLMQEAQANGAFPLSKALAGVVGLSLDDLRSRAKEMELDPADEPQREAIFATAFALRWLETFAADESAVWSMVAAKSRKWLNSFKASGPGGQSLRTWLALILKS